VSCQAYPGEPMRSTTVMRAVAETVVLAGADGVRLQGVDDIKAVKARLDVPILGLIKRGNAGVFITPTLRDVQAVCEAGADIVAIDGTERPRPDGSPLKGSIDLAHDMGKTVMADCSSVEDAQYCEANGVDIVSTTLAGYREGQHKTTGPDIGFIHDLRRSLRTPIFAEGRIGTPEEARACFEAGAVTVVVGTAITHPGRITQRFVDALGRR
jgi:N-acylglucosamine-6-phosphate 2-epimerase